MRSRSCRAVVLALNTCSRGLWSTRLNRRDRIPVSLGELTTEAGGQARSGPTPSMAVGRGKPLHVVACVDVRCHPALLCPVARGAKRQGPTNEGLGTDKSRVLLPRVIPVAFYWRVGEMGIFPAFPACCSEGRARRRSKPSLDS
jgi:hypothetical protein